MTTVTWQEDGQEPVTFTISDAFWESLEKYRLTQTAPTRLADGSYAALPKYNSRREMIIGIFMDVLVNPVQGMFPPDEVASAMAQAKAAQDAINAAKLAALQSAVATPPPQATLDATKACCS